MIESFLSLCGLTAAVILYKFVNIFKYLPFVGDLSQLTPGFYLLIALCTRGIALHARKI